MINISLICITKLEMMWMNPPNVKPIKIKKYQRRSFSVFKYGLNCMNNILNNTLNKLNINLLQFLSCA